MDSVIKFPPAHLTNPKSSSTLLDSLHQIIMCGHGVSLVLLLSAHFSLILEGPNVFYSLLYLLSLL